MDNNPDLQKIDKIITNSLKVALEDCGMQHTKSYAPDYRPSWPVASVSYLAQGEYASTRYNEKIPTRIQLASPAVTVLPENVSYNTQIISPEGATFYWGHIHFKIMETVDLTSLLNQPIIIKEPAAVEQIGQYLKEFIELFHNTPPSPTIFARIKSICYDILSILLSHSTFRSDAVFLFENHQRLTTLIHEISENYQAQWNIDKMTKIACLSRSRLHHLFKSIYGQPPLAFATAVRLRKACQLLVTTDLQIGEIAGTVGYNDPLYFSRCFTTLFGLSPSLYRETEGHDNPLKN